MSEQGANYPLKLNPFVVDPQAMAAISPLTCADCPKVAQMHCASMGHSLWAKLGPQFLTVLYRELLHDKNFRAFIYRDHRGIGGFIAGSLNGPKTFRSTWRRSWKKLLYPLLLGIIRRPAVLLPLVLTPFYFRRSDPASLVKAESFFCSFSPRLRGTRISGHINKVFFEEVFRCGEDFIKITTESDNEGSNRQLQSWGFQKRDTFSFYGKEMVTYVLDMRQHPRICQARPYMSQ